MTLFWFVIGGLTAAGLLFVILPLLLKRRAEASRLARSEINISIYRNQLTELESDLKSGDIDQDQYDKSRQEIERRLLEDTAGKEAGVASESRRLSTVTAVLAGLVVPVFAVGLYLEIGNLDALQPEKLTAAAESPHGSDQANMAAQVEMMVGKLAEKLQQDPSNIEGWVMLGRSYSVLGRYPEAVDAYKKAIQLAGEDPQLLADYADAIAMATGESLEGEPMQWLEKSLKLDPNNQKALWLMGTAMFERGDFGAAIVYWEHLQKMLPPDSQDANAMQANIDEARSYQQRQARGEFGKPAPSTATVAAEQLAKAAVPAGAARISGTVSLNRELLAKAAPTDTLFVFARAVSGPPMPLAVVRAQVKDLPLKFTLDESMAMMPNMSLAKFPEVVVGARISKTGNATPQPGDLQGQKGPVKVGSADLAIAIDSIVP